MSLVARPFIVDGVTWGTIYTFTEAGDVFPTHVHEEEKFNHITIVTFGAIRCTGHPNHEGTEIAAAPGGTIVGWTVGEPHGFTSMVAGTTIMNLLKVRGSLETTPAGG